MAVNLIKPLQTLQYFFIEKYPYFYKPSMEMKFNPDRDSVSFIKVKRWLGLEPVWTSIPIFGGTIAALVLIRSLHVVRLKCAHVKCPLLPLKITAWSWITLLVLCGTYAYYLLFVKFNREFTVGLEQLGSMRSKLLEKGNKQNIKFALILLKFVM